MPLNKQFPISHMGMNDKNWQNDKNKILGLALNTEVKFVDVERNQSWWSFPTLLYDILDIHEL